jgi:PAS domain S-box-containing protein
MDERDTGRGAACATTTQEDAHVATRRDLPVGVLAVRSRELHGPPRELVSSLGHELKTPLSIVLGLCGRLLAADGADDRRTDDVERIRANAYVLLKRVEELLQVARLDAGRLELDARPVDVVALVRQSLDGFASVADLRGQCLTLEAPSSLVADVDEEKLLSVVSNLIANALRLTPPDGRVRVGVAAARRRLRLEVADSGPGVPAGLREEIFERFEQGPGTAARSGGTGLGLAIVRELVALHRGTVTLGDAPEGGALFVVELPLRQRAGRARRATPATALVDVGERQRATVEELRAELRAAARRDGVGDEPSSAGAVVVTADDELGAYLGELVRRRHAPAHAATGAEAARLVAVAAPAVVLVDARAGVDAIAPLRGRGTPILALAGGVHDLPALVEAGADDCVVEPFAEDELLARLDALVARGRARADGAALAAGLGQAFDAAQAPMVLMTAEGRLVRVNRALAALLGHEDDALLTRCAQDLIHPDDLDDQVMRRRRLLDGGIVVDRAAWRLARADGSWLAAEVSASVVGDGPGAPDLVLWQLAGAPLDPARGGAAVADGAGRRAFDRAVRHQLLRCERYGEQASIVRCLLPDLGDVGREHGPDVAERLRARVLDAVRERLRDTDVVAAVGPHELGALLAHADADAATTAAAAVREAAERERVVTPEGPVGTRAIVGVAPIARAASAARAFFEAGLALSAGEGEGEGAPRPGRPVSP